MKPLKNFLGKLEENLVVVRIAAYGGFTTGRPIPSLGDSLLSESQYRKKSSFPPNPADLKANLTRRVDRRNFTSSPPQIRT